MTYSSLNEKAVEQILGMNEKVVSELQKVENFDFNIFKVQEVSKDNELVSVVCYLFAREKLFDKLPIRNDKFINFVKKVQSSYCDITYHNKTHATDLAQTFFYISN